MPKLSHTEQRMGERRRAKQTVAAMCRHKVSAGSVAASAYCKCCQQVRFACFEARRCVCAAPPPPLGGVKKLSPPSVAAKCRQGLARPPPQMCRRQVSPNSVVGRRAHKPPRTAMPKCRQEVSPPPPGGTCRSCAGGAATLSGDTWRRQRRFPDKDTAQ